MKCIICEEELRHYFTKDFGQSESKMDRLSNLGKVEYSQCPHCGFVLSKTHAEMEPNQWKRLNVEFHSFGEDSHYLGEHNQPPYLEQATFINVLSRNALISDSILDWGGGVGTLARILNKYVNRRIRVFDRYVHGSASEAVDYITADELSVQRFGTVINSAVFEHVTRRADLEEINQCVLPDGCLILHTVVCETIPRDPKWFYLGAVHCAFHTNRSMSVLMHQWGYQASVYCPLAKCWLLVKKDCDVLLQKSEEINRELQQRYLYYKTGFMDYWK